MPRQRSLEQQLQAAITTDPVKSAKAVGLRYVTDDGPGIQRKRAGKGFSYIDVDGKRIRDRQERQRIEDLRIPPAWEDVWICPLPNGHLQATGRDAKGRKQYRYHARWQEIRNQTKFVRMIAFSEVLPRLREQVEHDLALRGLPREKVLATIIRLMELTRIRVGNEEYARTNRSFGLTTMRDRHVDISGTKLRFHFRGKSGVKHDIELSDKRLAKIVKRCQEIPGQELFQYIDDEGQRQTIDSGDVNDYLRNITGQDFTAKDFRTWSGTVLAAIELRACEFCESQTKTKKNVTQAIKAVASCLGNKPATCRKYYVHPAVLDAYTAGLLHEVMTDCEPDEVRKITAQLCQEELAVVSILKQQFREIQTQRKAS